ncbi:dehydrogenase/reductase SDR family protein 7-like [Harpegnathos saltator]|uniref:Dehydrogenase/reductase SDR family protein 7-like n=1 Tax=Harpegnathos saltator TaxID=610380 RepID=E2BU12_HARSA|nr:dehydrogenase/reductase SDR family protein 7-like [Harpegnathos saltator]XP_011145085.1 dehydrogenase/reductase SDR family protein 7-like [Harpegnathos saltator]EFN80815.1 Dehydrogenase/reductase SDR family protein 7-like [Harpegnathos saltator]
MGQKQEAAEYHMFPNIARWLFLIFGFPIVLTWSAYSLLDIMWLRQKRKSLKNKVVMITGASSGLGEALAHVFYKCGCKLILVSRREEELKRVRNDLTNTYQIVPTHLPVILPLDLAKIDDMKSKVLKVLLVHDGIDILINNAGVSYRGEVISTDIDVDMKVMMSNYFSQVCLTKIILPFMIKQNSGHIVGISSVQGRIAIPYRSAYAASKYSVQAWYDSARAEIFNKNIKFTIVNPGYIKTSLSMNALTGSGQVYGIMDETTVNGYEPDYVAERILEAVLKQKKEVTIAPFLVKCAIIIRTLFPSLFFWLMQKRAKKLANNR